MRIPFLLYVQRPRSQANRTRTWGLKATDFKTAIASSISPLVFWNTSQRSSETTPTSLPRAHQTICVSTWGFLSKEHLHGEPLRVNLKSALSLRMVIRYSDRDVNIRSENQSIEEAYIWTTCDILTRFFSPFHDQIVYHDSSIPICTRENKGGFVKCWETSIYSCYNSLCCRFFISSGSCQGVKDKCDIIMREGSPLIWPARNKPCPWVSLFEYVAVKSTNLYSFGLQCC